MVDSIPDRLGKVRLEMGIDSLFRPLDNPLHDGGAGLVHEVIGVVLDVAFPCDLRIERNDDKPAPDAVIVSADLR